MRRAPILSCLLWSAACGNTETFIDAAVPTELDVEASAISFGDADCGTTPEAETLELGNPSNEPIAWSATIDGAGFTIEGDAEGTVAPGGTGSITIRPDPVAATAVADETIAANLVISTDARDFDVPLSIKPRGAGITLSPTTADFGTAPVGTAATDVTVMVSNTGNAPVQLAIADAADEFTVSYPGAPAAVTLAASGNFPVTLGFAPTDTAGTRDVTAAFDVTGVTCAGATELPMTGVASTGTLSFPAFPSMTADCGVATPSDTSLTLTNTSATSPVTVTSASATGGFTVTTTLPLTIPPNQSASLAVRPPASVVGTDLGGATKSGTLSFSTNETGNPTHDVALSSTVVGANLVVTDAADTTPLTSMSFDADSSCPSSRSLSVRNTGNATLNDLSHSTTTGTLYFPQSPGSSIDAGASSPMTVAISTAGPCDGDDDLYFYWSASNVCTTSPVVVSTTFSITGMSGCYCS